MAVELPTEKRFEEDIEAAFLSQNGGYTKTDDIYDPKEGLYVNTFVEFIKATQPKEWRRHILLCGSDDPVKKLLGAFHTAVNSFGILDVLRHGFKHKGITFRVCYFKPESHLNKTATARYEQNVCNCVRQWHYSANNSKSVDMVLVINGIPIVALELKNQYTGQNIDNAKRQWMYDRDPCEICFRFNSRILAYYCVDHTDVCMATHLNKGDTYFLPFNQGSNGAGNDGGKGNPANPNGYPTAYFWENVLQKDSLLDILQKFIQYDKKNKRLIFPRFHQLDVVRKLIADVKKNGSGKNYLIQHSAGSGKSNSIVWLTYRLSSLHDENNKPIFNSVIVVTDLRVLDAQLQDAITGFEHTVGSVTTIDEKKTSKDLLDAINRGDRIIVTTLQKFPVIYKEVDETSGKQYAIVVDEAHSSQTGDSAIKLKKALADTEEALREYAELEGKAEDEIDKHDKIIDELLSHGQHKNLSFFAFTATPKPETLNMFGTKYEDGSFHPFHVYSMRQAIEEGFIMDVLQNYMTYETCYQISKTIPDNPDVPSSKAAKTIKRFASLHSYGIQQKAQIIVETFRSTTSQAIGGKGKMMVVTSSRLAAVRYYHEIKQYIKEQGYNNVDVLAAFSGAVQDGGNEYTEHGLNVRKDGSHISESQTKSEFHENFNILVVAEKYQTGFDEPLLHTMIIDKKLKGVKCVQTLSRLNRICPGKTDTFILDFVNTADEIKEAFQPFYQETSLGEEVNIDLIYKTQQELHDFNVYTSVDVDNFDKVYFSQGKQNSIMFGKMTSALKPVTERYNALNADDKYHFRRKMRSFVKWYGYIAQICRMFDKEMHKEYVFCAYLINLIKDESPEMIDIENALKLEFFKLSETFKGAIPLQPTGTILDPGAKTGIGAPGKKEPLDEVIDRINDLFAGEFVDADRVIVSTLIDKLKDDKKLRHEAKRTDEKIFVESIFNKNFDDAAQNNYTEQNEAYTSLFKDTGKYNAFKKAIGEFLYRIFNNED